MLRAKATSAGRHEGIMTTTVPAAPPQPDPILGPPPFRRPHYAADRFLQINAAAGTAATIYGERVLRASEDFLAALRRALEQEVGGAAGAVLYETGRRWGAADMRAFVARAPEEFGAAYDAVHMGVLLETWWWPRAVGGWGSASFDFRRAGQRLVFLEVRDSAEARALPGANRPVCDLYAGYFAGGLSVLARRDLACAELQCRAAGAESCRFLFSTPAQTDQARQWRDAGESAADIVRKLTGSP
jgi:bacteriochlorophyll 4-vinyl reductase